MKTYERTFTNPLLALAFIDGVSFTDKNYTCKTPERKGESRWVVEIEQVEENETTAETKSGVSDNVAGGKTMMEAAAALSSIPNKPSIINEDPAKYFTRTVSSETKHRKYVPPDKTIDALASSLPPPKKIKAPGEVETEQNDKLDTIDDAAKQSIDQWLTDRAAENEIDVNDSDIIDMRDLNDDNESMPLAGLGGLATWPCGACLGCSANDTCVAEVNNACLTQNMIANLTK